MSAWDLEKGVVELSARISEAVSGWRLNHHIIDNQHHSTKVFSRDDTQDSCSRVEGLSRMLTTGGNKTKRKWSFIVRFSN